MNQTTLGIRVDYVHQNIVYEDRYASIFVISTKAIRNWTNTNLEDSASLVTNSTSTTSDGTKIIWNERWENETDKKLTIEGNLWTYQSNRSWSQKYGDSQTGVKYIDDWFFEIFTFDVNTGVLQYNYRDYREYIYEIKILNGSGLTTLSIHDLGSILLACFVFVVIKRNSN